jgi:hypothetical protein
MGLVQRTLFNYLGNKWTVQRKPIGYRITPRAASVTEAVLGAAIEGFEGGAATNPSHRSIEPHRVLGSSRRAPRAVEKAQALPSCKASSFLGTHGAAWREAHLSERGE